MVPSTSRPRVDRSRNAVTASFAQSDPVNRVCNKPLWIRAKGTTRWTLHLGRGLPPGRYLEYSRASNKAGVGEDVFGAKDRNRIEFAAG